MKIMTILGTRPEIIRLSLIIPRLDRLCQHILVHTEQNFDPTLSDNFFTELALRKPDYFLGVRASSLGEQLAQIFSRCETVMRTEQPQRLLILGDTNSGLAAILAKRLGISVYHLEAGNRCFQLGVPEEVNRKIIDHLSDVLLPYTERSRLNLLQEGIAPDRIHVIGNPMVEVLRHLAPQIAESRILAKLNLQPGHYFLITIHRQENVGDPTRLHKILEASQALHQAYSLPVIFSLHPRTRDSLARFNVPPPPEQLRLYPPFGFFDFVTLEQRALCVLTDSGTVQEECCLLQVPNVTLRDQTERPETVECGANLISGVQPESILRSVRTVLDQRDDWPIPVEYTRSNTSATVANIVLGQPEFGLGGIK